MGPSCVSCCGSLGSRVGTGEYSPQLEDMTTMSFAATKTVCVT